MLKWISFDVQGETRRRKVLCMKIEDNIDIWTHWVAITHKAQKKAQYMVGVVVHRTTKLMSCVGWWI